VQPIEVNGKMIYPVFGTVTQADETLTGLFEDLSVVDLTDAEPQPDPAMFDVNTDADGNNILSPTAYDIVSPVLSDAERALAIQTLALTNSIGLLENKITVDPVLGAQLAAGSPTSSESLSRLNTAMVSVPDGGERLEIPAVATSNTSNNSLSATLKTDDTSSGIMLKGFVEASVDGTNFVHIDSGTQEMLLASGHQLIARKGSLLWLEQDDEKKVCVKAASDGVCVKLTHGVQVHLAPGEELVWTRDSRDAAACLKDGIARRNIKRHMLPDGSCVVVAEFSLLHHLSKQSDPALLPYRERMLKTIAALNVACRHHGRYRLLANAG
jgi:hypothetical protein